MPEDPTNKPKSDVIGDTIGASGMSDQGNETRSQVNAIRLAPKSFKN